MKQSRAFFIYKTLAMKKNKLVILLLGIALLSIEARAQETSDYSPTTEKKKVEFKIGLNYNSRLNYYGRTDSLKSSGIYPSVEINYSGWFIKSDFIFINNSVINTQYTGSIVSGGYNFSDSKEKFSGSIYLSKFFYQDNSTLVQSAIKEQAVASLSFLNKIININIGGDAKFNKATDYGATAGLDHLQRFELNDGKTIIVLDPSVYAYAGTQNFTETYYQKKNFLIFPVGQEEVTKNSKQFNILAYEASLPVVLATGKLIFSLTPSYILPQNLVQVPGRPELSETGKNLFYITAGVTVKF